MALDARRRQRKVEKRNAKEKAKRKVLALRKADDFGQRIARAAAAPILHCCTTQSLWDDGIAQVLVSRELASGQVVFSLFLIDRYCLGVKDAVCSFGSRADYFDRLYDRLATQGEVVALQPAAARKLVEGAVEYAKGLGLSPHADYARARLIFGDINPAESDREFEFGRKGKPFFVAGPHDTRGRIASILGILAGRLGHEGFHFLIPVAPDTQISDDGLMFQGDESDEVDDDDGGQDDFGGNAAESAVAETPDSLRRFWDPSHRGS